MKEVWVITETVPFEEHGEVVAVCANKGIAEKLVEEYRDLTNDYFVYKIELWPIAK